MKVIHAYHDLVRGDVLEFVPEGLGRVLDVGGGIGATPAAFKARGKASHIVLLDQVATTSAEGVDEAIAVDLDRIDEIRRIGEQHGPFDTILCLDILEHLRDPWETVRALHPLLAQDGKMIVSVPNMNFFKVVWQLVMKGRFDLTDEGIMDRTHLRWFTPATAVELATVSGLRVTGTRPNIYGWKKALLARLSGGLLTRFLAVQFVVKVARP